MNDTAPDAAEVALKLASLRHSAEDITARTQIIYERVLRDSSRISTPNFTSIAAADLALLFDLYDGQFFDGGLTRLVKSTGAPLRFDLSARLTRSAGVTKRFSARPRKGAPDPPPTRFEI